MFTASALFAAWILAVCLLNHLSMYYASNIDGVFLHEIISPFVLNAAVLK